MPMRDADDRIIQAARRDVFAGRLSRREFMRLMSALGLSAGAAALAACGGAATPAPTTAPPGEAPATAAPTAPAPGGAAATLRVATEIPVQLDPALASSDAEILSLHLLYHYLGDIHARNEIVPRLV
ncbi:MAG: hypothetical protein N2378_08835, partial [Chloroflexaceae bacterium]|nr:hypothetical protein [Chloroflexaceae bacterium]